ncbi:MAG: YbaY family lipoprotein [Pseudomonadales bacterium]|nr:YbaY family lipoprotein [Pseudomonadales bacterium]
MMRSHSGITLGWMSLLLLTMGLLAGCDNDPRATGEAPAVKGEQRVLSGKVMYREKIAMPEGATLTVSLADVSRMDAPADIIAEQHIDAPGQVPVPFALRYQADAVDPERAMAYAVRAEIRGAGGELLWTTTQRNDVDFSAGVPADMTLMLEKVGSVKSGAVIMNREQARKRGADFWAQGNEPGWHLVIVPEEVLVFVGDYGQRTVTVPNAGALTEDTVTLYESTTETAALRVEIEKVTCEDDMSGQAFDYQVSVTVNQTLYRGCGEDL